MITIKCSWCPGPMYTFTLRDSMQVYDFLMTTGKVVLGSRKIEDADVTVQPRNGLLRTNAVDVMLDDGDVVILRNPVDTDTYKYVPETGERVYTLWERIKLWLQKQWLLWGWHGY